MCDRVESKIDIIQEKISLIERLMERNTVSLEHHIKRTDLLEEKLEPVENHVKLINGIVKILLGLAALTALLKIV